MKYRDSYRCRISEKDLRDCPEFCLNLTALQTTQLPHLNRNTINRFYHELRQRIVGVCENEGFMSGVVEVERRACLGQDV